MKHFRLKTMMQILVIMIAAMAILQPISVQSQERIIIGLAGRNFSFLPFQIAQEKGFYRKHGLEVQSVWMRAQASIPALLSGDIDYDTRFGSVIRAALRSLEMRVVFSTADRQMYSLVSQPEIQSVAELKGKLIGISSFGAAQHLVTVAVFKAFGLNSDRDVKMISIGNEAVRMHQLRMKQIAAAMINPPMSIMMKHEGFGLLVHAADYLELPLTGLGATTKKLRENPEQVKKVLRALYEALQFVRSNKKETVEISSRWLQLDPKISAETYDLALKVLTRDGTASDKGIVAAIEEAKETGKMSGNFSPQDVADFSILRTVLREYEPRK